jgi:nucleotide-binding universal stress UspA family protein
MSFSTILVPIDYEAAADAALRLAGRLARARQGTLVVAHALPLPIYPMATLPIPPVDTRWVEDEKLRLRAHAVAVLQRDGEVPPFEVDVGVDAPAVRILQLAAERHADLIVMGTHGRTGFRHLFLGSMAERVVRLAPCPVLTLHGAPEARFGAAAASEVLADYARAAREPSG